MPRIVTHALAFVLATLAFYAGSSAAIAKPTVEVAFVLDTTGSMGGLIEGAKRKIWSIATASAVGDCRRSTGSEAASEPVLMECKIPGSGTSALERR